eukprot:CAMPEP_0198307614 /NCGR_PEP_ID=MMETSP1450-20131203/445_1 /TAXON_ID=753684 ORGANISM="Madagascaria erythrocladiodes, Strain CCMP3234" /NCGR_SAMPLE_ID=MMETSP1450 /ASSEMBLY_ACC=CAM_ASM_001115 /LENGTH=245 /DNA_ID=CAMNT_0044010203 /DNA_START=86 /DNA_END=823 /DNA_ORIENTATION=+
MAENRPTAGARFEAEVPKGKHALQLYSAATPNGQKAAIVLEESGLPYDAHFISIGSGDQFSSGFTAINPNGKIPALVDNDGPGGKPFTVFESGAILMYVAEKSPESGLFPTDPAKRSTTIQWLFFQVGTGPYLGNFNHFRNAKEHLPYAIERFGMETRRVMDVLDKRLADQRFLVGDDYTIADIANFTWARSMQASGAVDLSEYKNLARWIEEVGARPAVKMGLQINGFKDTTYQNYSSEGRERK